jgi:hypothetical protein
MTEINHNDLENSNNTSDIKWFAPASTNNISPQVHEEYLDALAYAPRKVDILIRADDAPGVAQSDLIERLATHPKVDTIIIYGLSHTQKMLIAARAAMYGVHVRFCNTEEEVRVLLNKRRSRIILDTVPGFFMGRDDAGHQNLH